MFIKTWNWFSGKKTAIAAFILVLSAFCQQVLIGVWGADWTWLPFLISTFEWIGMVLGGTGLVHKAAKNATQ